MSIVIADARKWQNVFDLRSGEKFEAHDRTIGMVRQVLGRHPYPGDVANASNRWVTETALDLIGEYRPELVFLNYSQQYFAQRFTPHSEPELRNLFAGVIAEVLRFIEETGYTPIIVGTGDMTDLKGELDLSTLDGLVSANGGSRLAGLYTPSGRDLAIAASHPGIKRLVSRDEWTSLFPASRQERSRLPDYLMICREGWTVRAAGTPLRRPARVQSCNFVIPVATPLGSIASLTEVRDLIERNLGSHRIALIVLEGMGVNHFPLPYMPCGNGLDWYCYETGEGQYLTMTTGRQQIFAYPPGHRLSEETLTQRDFPFSGHFREIPEHTLGADFSGRSIAVGNRSMFTHMVFGADISIECFARNLYNQGSIAVMKKKILENTPMKSRQTSKAA